MRRQRSAVQFSARPGSRLHRLPNPLTPAAATPAPHPLEISDEFSCLRHVDEARCLSPRTSKFRLTRAMTALSLQGGTFGAHPPIWPVTRVCRMAYAHVALAIDLTQRSSRSEAGPSVAAHQGGETHVSILRLRPDFARTCGLELRPLRFRRNLRVWEFEVPAPARVFHSYFLRVSHEEDRRKQDFFSWG
jgi:hypothetical protein